MKWNWPGLCWNEPSPDKRSGDQQAPRWFPFAPPLTHILCCLCQPQRICIFDDKNCTLPPSCNEVRASAPLRTIAKRAQTSNAHED